MIVLDASAFIAFTQSSDPHHEHATVLIENTDEPLAMHAVTITECLVGATAAGRAAAAVGLIQALGITRIDLDDNAPARVAALRVGTSLKLPDCFVLDAARTHAASVATFDIRLARTARDLGVALAA